MRSTTLTNTAVGSTSGAGFDVLNDANGMTIAGAALGTITCGGALFIGAAVAPAHVVGGALAAGAFLTAGEVKSRTGSYLPFLKDKETVTPASEATVTV
jgi:hypothetical protein